MAAAPKRSSKPRGKATSRESKARSIPPIKKTAQKPARLRPRTNRKDAGIRRAGRTDRVAAVQLEAVAHGLEQIGDIRAQLEDLRSTIEEIAQNVASLVADHLAQELDPDQSAPAVTDEDLIVEIDEAAANEDEPGLP